MNTMDFLIKQNDQISILMPECDNVHADRQDKK
jgi:hypothetical protein